MDWKQRYPIISAINETFKGALFLAKDLETNRDVILRVLYHTNAEYYNILQQITSPHFPKIFQVIRDQEDTIVVEEYVQGETLSKRMENGTPISFAETLHILTQLCEALDVIHSKGIIHRDIKPSNIILSGDKVMLIDFDAARKHQQSSQKDTVYMGTEGYAAPEQYGFSQTDSRSDIYSLGVVIRELIGNNKRHCLMPIIERCTAFDPANRYRSTKEILRELETMDLIHPSQNSARPSGQQSTWTRPSGFRFNGGHTGSSDSNARADSFNRKDQTDIPNRDTTSADTGPHTRTTNNNHNAWTKENEEPVYSGDANTAFAGKRAQRHSPSKKKTKVILGIVWGIMTLIILEPKAYDVTTLDYILTRLVYLPFVIFPAVLSMNLFYVWQKIPLLRSPKTSRKVLGIVLCAVALVIIVILLNVLAHIFYSPEAQKILSEVSAST
ncbi:serine/threonine-protein kinase [Solibaculum mannosilyticum]|uniref:non-specific serine/threonine protein kinase n=1 Tax=Solibaculum mannosilyticum TaxID=2780922 RepID=A0A7I8D7W7_9FIRM|nr:serine/threonine-protein kinase [Solibaculum mannosilyticum]BCI60724.1 hypothetical protein C12CBH8_13630 [Solibaculum mannosilyticum]